MSVDHESRYIEEKDGNKYLIFDSTDENKELLKIQWCLKWNQKRNQNNKWWEREWLWKKLHEN